MPTDTTGISSDMYFGRGAHDPSGSAEAQQRLQNFAGATDISRNAYFGREEEDDEHGEGGGQGHAYGGGGGGDSLLDNETIAGLERGVRDMAGRVMANPEVQAVGEQLRQGLLKVCRHSG